MHRLVFRSLVPLAFLVAGCALFRNSTVEPPPLEAGLPECVRVKCGASYIVKTLWDTRALYNLDPDAASSLAVCTNLEGDTTFKDKNLVKGNVRACFEKSKQRDAATVDQAMRKWETISTSCAESQKTWDACYKGCLTPAPVAVGAASVSAKITVCDAGYDQVGDGRCCWKKDVSAGFGWKQGPAVPLGTTVEIAASGTWTVVRESGPEGNGVPAGRPGFILNKSDGGVEGQLVIKDGSGARRGMSGPKMHVNTPGTLSFMANDEDGPAKIFGHEGFADNHGSLSVSVCYAPGR